MEVSITVDDAAVRALLDQTPRRIDRAMTSAMHDATSYLLRQMRVYPSPPAGSKYRRTGTLARSWHVPPFQGSGLSLVGRVASSGTTAPYNRWVQDRARQAYMHVGRWQTAQDVAERSTQAINDMFQNRIRAAVGR